MADEAAGIEVAESPGLSLASLAELVPEVPAESAAEAEVEGEEPPAEDAEAAAEGEAEAETEKEAEPEADTEAAAEPDPFTDEAMSTPEGIKAAVKAARTLVETAQAEKAKVQREANQIHLRAKKREAKLAPRLAELKQEKNLLHAQKQQLSADVQLVRSGDARQALEAFGRIAGRDPYQLFDEMSLNIAQNGKAARQEQADSKVAQQLEQMQKKLDAYESQAKQQQAVAQRQQMVGNYIQQNAVQYPQIAEYAEKHGVEQTVLEIEQVGATLSQQRQRALDVLDVLSHVELGLTRQKKAEPPAEEQEAAPERSGKAAKKPGRAHSTPGKTLSPNLSGQDSGKRRVLTEEERIRDAASLIPDDMFRAPQ